MTDRLLGTDPTAVAGGDALVVLTTAALRVAVPIGAVLVLGAFALRGPVGGVTAFVTAVVLVGLHVGSGIATARLSRHNAQAMPAITMAALLLRLVVYGIAVAVFGGSTAVDVPSLAVTVIILTLAMLVVESWAVARYSKHWWQPTETADARSHPTPPGADSASAQAKERTQA